MKTIGIVLAVAFVLAYGARADDQSLVKLYAQPAAVLDARLSPDGTRVGLIATFQGSQVLYVHSLVEGGKDGRIVRADDFKIRWIRWKDNDHLVAGVSKVTDRLFYDEAPGAHIISRLISVDANGENMRWIGEPPGGFVNTGMGARKFPRIHPQEQDEILSILPGTPGRILQSVVDKIPTRSQQLGEALYTVDVATGEHETADSGDPRMGSYLVDGDAVARAGMEYLPRETVVHARKSRHDSWREVRRVKNDDDEIFTPLAFVPGNPRLLYVLSSKGRDGDGGLWSFDITSGQFAERIDEQADLMQEAAVEDGILLGYRRKDGSRAYLDPAWQADYLAVRKAMKGADVKVVDRAADGSHVLLEVHQPYQPKVWWLLDRTVKPLNLWPAVEEYPSIPADQVAAVQEVSYTARDGLKIPAHLTLPIGYKGGPIPFVVLPHDGPYTCEPKVFDYEVQFLARRGWGVLQPQYRGTSCYGPEFELKGYRESGFAIQDDITDGTRWLIDQNYADRSRICILGKSYGGYAALEGVVKEPDLFRCAAAWAPQTDLLHARREGRLRLYFESEQDRIGTDLSRLDAASPARHADRIKVPVLLMHGRADFEVDVDHSRTMEKSLLDAHKTVEAIYLDHADHDRSDFDSRYAWLSALDRFLGAQLGKP